MTSLCSSNAYVHQTCNRCRFILIYRTAFCRFVKSSLRRASVSTSPPSKLMMRPVPTTRVFFWTQFPSPSSVPLRTSKHLMAVLLRVVNIFGVWPKVRTRIILFSCPTDALSSSREREPLRLQKVALVAHRYAHARPDHPL